MSNPNQSTPSDELGSLVGQLTEQVIALRKSVESLAHRGRIDRIVVGLVFVILIAGGTGFGLVVAQGYSNQRSTQHALKETREQSYESCMLRNKQAAVSSTLFSKASTLFTAIEKSEQESVDTPQVRAIQEKAYADFLNAVKPYTTPQPPVNCAANLDPSLPTSP